MWNPFRRREKQGGAAEPELVFGKYEYSAEPEVESQEQIAEGVSFETPVIEEGILEPPGIPEIGEFREDRWTAGLRKTVRGLLLALTALVPVFFLTLTAPGEVLAISKQNLIYVFAMLGLVLWLALIVRQGGAALKRSGFELGLAVFLTAMLSAALFSSQVFLSFVAPGGFITLASLVLLLFLFLNFFEPKDVSRAVDWFLLGSFLAALAGILGFFGVPVFKWLSLVTKGITVGNQFNTVGSVNVLAGMASMAFVLAAGRVFQGAGAGDITDLQGIQDLPGAHVGLRGRQVRLIWGVVRLAAMAASAVLVLIVNWWPYYLVLAVGMAAIVSAPSVIGKLSGTRPRVKTVNLIIPMAILVLSALLLLGARYFNFNFYGRFNLPVEVSLSQKASFIIAREAIKDRPVFGYGPGNFYLVFDKHKPPAVNNSVFWNARFSSGASELLNLPVNAGLVGLGAMLVLIFFVLKAAAAGVKREANQFAAAGALWQVIPALLAGLTLFTLYPLSNIVLLFSFWLILSLVAAALGAEQSGRKVMMNNSSWPSILSSLAFVLVLIFGLVGGYALGRKTQGEYYFARAQRISVDSQAAFEETARLLTGAVNANNSDIRYLNALSQLISSRIGVELNNRGEQPEVVAARLQQLTQNVVQAANQMTANYKNDAASWSNAGFIYQNLIQLVGGADEAAIAAYQEALKRAPHDPEGYVKIGAVYFNRAERNRAALIDARNRRVAVKNEKEVLDLIAGDYKSAEENFKKAVELKGDLATSLYNLGVVYERQGRVKEAVKQLELTRVGNLGNPGLAFELGLLYYRDGQKNNAFNEMVRAVGLFRDYSNARWYLALMLEEQGRIDEAIGQLKEILRLEVNKDNPVVLEKLASLEAGKREIPPAKVTSRQPIEAKAPRQK